MSAKEFKESFKRYAFFPRTKIDYWTFRKLRHLKSQHVGSQGWDEWLRYLARDVNLNPTLHERVMEGTAKTLLPTWMQNFAENLPFIRYGDEAQVLIPEHPIQNTIATIIKPPPVIEGEPDYASIDGPVEEIQQIKIKRPPQGTAIVVGRGPSLFKHKHCEMLADALNSGKYKGMVCASDGALPPLLDAEVVPDIVVTVDGSPVIKKYFEHPMLAKHASEIKWITTVTLSPEVYQAARKIGLHPYWFNPMFDDWRQNESWTKLQRLMGKTKDFPMGIPAANSGGNAGACLPDGEPLTTLNGENPIENVSIGELVLTHTGTFEKVAEKYERDYFGNMITIKCVGGMNFRVTEDHPIFVLRQSEKYRGKARIWRRMNHYEHRWDLTRATRKMMRDDFSQNDFEWIEAGKLTKHDYLVFPIPSHIEDKVTMMLENKFALLLQQREKIDKMRKDTGWGSKRIAKTLGISIGTVSSRLYNKKRDKNTLPCGANTVNLNVSINSDLMLLVGYYLAEGSTTDGAIRFAFHRKEYLHHQKVEDLFKSIFALKGAKWIPKNTGNSLAIEFQSVLIAPFFKQFGKEAKKKTIPLWILTLPVEKQLSLIAGLFYGDGTIIGNGYAIDSASKQLLLDARQILLRAGIYSTLHNEERQGPNIICGRKCHANSKWRLCVQGVAGDKLRSFLHLPIPPKSGNQRFERVGINQNFIVSPITALKVSEYRGKVHNLDVENSHSFCNIASMVTMHNCAWVMAVNVFCRRNVGLIGMDLGYPEGTKLEDTQYFCYSSDTRILTDKGFKHFYELNQEDDCIATLNRETGYMEYQKANNVVSFQYKGKLLHFDGHNYNLLVTPNHRLYCKNSCNHRSGYKFIEAKDLATKVHRARSSLTLDRRMKWGGSDNDIITIPTLPHRFPLLERKYKTAMSLRAENGWGCGKIAANLDLDWTTVYGWICKNRNPQRAGGNPRNIKSFPTDLWMKFMGWYISEGSLVKRDHRISIPQGKTEYFSEIRQIIEALGFKTRTVQYSNVLGIEFYSKQICAYLEPLGQARQKYIPPELKQLSPKHLRILLFTLCKGDGSFNKGVPRFYNTTSKRLADDVVEIALKCGYVATIGQAKSHQFKYYRVSIHNRHFEIYMSGKLQEIDYDGFVHCVTVPNEVILVERKGKPVWCGNSSVIREAKGDVALVKSAYPEFYHPVFKSKAFVDTVFYHYRQAFLTMAQTAPIWYRLYGDTINATEGGTLWGPSIRCMHFAEFLREYSF